MSRYSKGVFFLLVMQISFAQWFWQNPLPQGHTLRSVKFFSSSVGWAVGDDGTIIKTTDGGPTFTIQNDLSQKKRSNY